MTSLQSRPAVGYTLNQYFKQWLSRKREICFFSVWTDRIGPENASLKPNALFSGLRFKLIWSKETHDASIISQISFDHVNPMFHDETIHMIHRGDKKLLVIVDSQRLFAGEVESARDAVQGRICLPEAQKIDLEPEDQEAYEEDPSESQQGWTCAVS